MQPSRSSSPDREAGEIAGPAPVGRPTGGHRHGRWWSRGLNWTRIVHVYTSMTALLLVLFFGATGITLNHPEWTFGFDPVSTDSAGTLPAGWVGEDGAVQFLTVSEFLRSDYGVDGTVVDFGVDATDGFISYREPGYAADVFFNLDSGDFRLTVQQQGWIGVFNALHRGSDAGSAWRWVIDAAGGFLVLVALTGLGLQLFLAKRRRAAVVSALAGGVVVVVLVWITVG